MKSKVRIIRTTEGYMVELPNGDYLCDEHGDNTWETRGEAEREIAFALGAEAMMNRPEKPWDDFNRMHLTDNFYGCVAPVGLWFDSGMPYITAVTHCCYKEGQFDLSIAQEAEWMSTEGAKLGYSVIHSGMIKQMYEKGLIK